MLAKTFWDVLKSRGLNFFAGVPDSTFQAAYHWMVEDPEIRYTQNGTAVANFSLATTDSWSKDGETNERTEWHNIVAWARLAEICNQYLHKGKQVYIEGRIQTRKWEDRDGNGVVDFQDLLAVLSAWGQCPPPDLCPEDADGDGIIGFLDLLLVLSNWG